MDRMRPIRAKNIIYGIHHYAPFQFSHQGLGNKKKVFTYPSVIDGLKWDKEMMRRELAPARQFQQAYNVPIFVSEFCCVSWGKDDGRWTRDCIELFEEYGWDWMWHCIAEFEAWNPHKDANLKTVKETERSKVLNEYFAKNKFPQKFDAVKPVPKKYGDFLYRKPDVQSLKNYKAWRSISLFSGNFQDNFQVTLKMRILRTNKGFASVRLTGENASCNVMIRSSGVSYQMNGKNERAFQNGGVSVAEREWGQYDIIVADGKLKVAANGVLCGEIPFVPEEIAGIGIFGASTDLEVKDVEVRNLRKTSGSFAPFQKLEQIKDIYLYQSPPETVLPVSNFDAWKTLPLYSGSTSEALAGSMEFRILKEKKGFVYIDISGTNGVFKVILRPNNANFTCTQKEPPLKRVETGFPKSKYQAKPGEWQKLAFELNGNSIALFINGQECGCVEFIPGKISKIVLAAAYADCEFRNVKIRYRDPEKITDLQKGTTK